jgi:tungstate transport system substrate-binding protein
MKRVFWLVALLVTLVAALGLVACGENGGSKETATPKAAATATPQAATTGTPKAATTGTPQAAGTATPVVRSGPKEIILATTTSTQDSGLLDILVPEFEKDSGYNVKVIAVGSGQALAMGQRGDADVLLVHAPSSEKALIDDGSAINRRLVMHNDFVILGPEKDPAGIKGMTSAVDALKKVFDTGSSFISRGDDSGTNKAELSLWKTAGVDPKGKSWYVETGQGMGATLQVANQKDGYTLSDRATFLAQGEGFVLKVLVEGDPLLLNVYSVMQVNPDEFDLVNGPGGKAFADFMVSEKGQQMIGAYVDKKSGKPLFTPDAGKTYEEIGMKTPFG